MPRTARKKTVPRVPIGNLADQVEEILLDHAADPVRMLAHLCGLVRRREDKFARWMQANNLIQDAEYVINRYRYPTRKP